MHRKKPLFHATLLFFQYLGAPVTFTYLVLLTFSLVFATQSLDAAYIFKNGTFIHTKDLATLSVEEHFSQGIQAIKDKKFEDALQQFRIVTINFPQTTWAKEGYYFLGISYFHTDDKDLANQNLSLYLKEESNPQYFEEAFRYKLAIADAFKNGQKRHLFGYEKLPQWMPDTDLAITIYDEIIQILANHELGAKAALSKADLLRRHEQFRESIECLQTVIRKFPKSEYAQKAYAGIGKVYLKQAQADAHNPDILQLAEINKTKFYQEFPKDPEHEVITKQLGQMKEIFANALYETGKLYERKKLPKAAVLYYYNAINKFPETQVANQCKERIDALKEYADEIDLTS